MGSTLTKYVIIRLLVGFMDISTDFIRGGALLSSKHNVWGLVTLAFPFVSALMSVVNASLSKRSSKPLCFSALEIHARILEGLLNAGPQMLIFWASLLYKVHAEELGNILGISDEKNEEDGGGRGGRGGNFFLPYLELFSLSMSWISYVITSSYYDKESLKNGVLRFFSYFFTLISCSSFRIYLGGFLLALSPYYALALIIPVSYVLNLIVFKITGDSRDWECLFYAFSSLICPSGYARGRSNLSLTMNPNIILTYSDAKLARINQESLVQRLRLFLGLFHGLSLASLLILVVTYETSYVGNVLIGPFGNRSVVYGGAICLYFFSIVSSFFYHGNVVKSRDAVVLWDKITPAVNGEDKVIHKKERLSNTDVELQPVTTLGEQDLPFHISKSEVFLGNGRCCPPGEKECVTCDFMIEGSVFRSTMTGKEYRFMPRVNCMTNNVIYLVTCNKCKKQYVGKTEQKLKQRHYGHRREIETAISPLGKHFAGECGYINWRFQIIDKCDVTEDLTRREGYWQQELDTYVPHGLNMRREKVNS